MDSMHGAFISWCCIWALFAVTVHRHVLKHGLKNTFECFPFHCFDLQLSLWTSDDPPERTPSSGNYDSLKHPCAICGGDHLCYRLDLHEPISPWQSPVGSCAPDFEVHSQREWHDDMSSWHAISFDVIKGVGHWWLQQSFLSDHNSNDDILKVTVSL